MNFFVQASPGRLVHILRPGTEHAWCGYSPKHGWFDERLEPHPWAHQCRRCIERTEKALARVSRFGHR